MTVTIKTNQGNKEYSTVAERLSALHEAKKSLEVIESAPFQAGDRWVWRVLIKVEDHTYVGNAEVHLDSTNFAEKADPWATAETSAIGRALAWCGYAGVPDSIASVDEVIRNQLQQQQEVRQAPAPAKPKEHKLNELFRLGKGKGLWSDLAGMADIATPIVGTECVTREDLLKLSEKDIQAMEAYINDEPARELARF